MDTPNTSTSAQLTQASKEQLMADFKAVIADAEALIKASANQGGEALAQARSKAQASLAAARAKMDDTEAALLERTKAAARATDAYVHDNPWQSIGIAAGLGVFIGFLMGRR